MPPINRLPDSILSDIFILTCYVGREWHAHGHAPYALASVSRLWRMVALSTSSLWNFIDAVLSPECVSAHLARSGVLPLDVSLDTSSLYKDAMRGSPRHVNADAFEKSLNLLHDNWARIQHLGVCLTADEHEHLVVDTFNRAINVCDNDSLISIFMDAKASDENGRVPGPRGNGVQLLLPHSDTLSRIELNSIDLRLTSRPYTCPLLGLRELDLCSQSTIQLSNTLFPLLELLPNLSRLALLEYTIADSWSAPPRPEHSISLPMLETLKLINICGWTGLNSVLHTLDIPGLRSLRYFNGLDMNEGLVAVIRRCKLEVLELIGPCVRAMDAVPSNTGSLGELKRLVVLPDNEEPLNGLVERLAHRLCEVTYCPMLEFLGVPRLSDLESVKAIDKLRSSLLNPHLRFNSDSDQSNCGREPGA